MGEMDDIAPISPSPLEITLGGKDKSSENKVVVRMQIGWTWDEMRWKKYDPQQWFLCLSILEFGFWGFKSYGSTFEKAVLLFTMFQRIIRSAFFKIVSSFSTMNHSHYGNAKFITLM